ncbi:MAG TPA: M1 family metallopeptidase [Longimicrobiaceae bacterium]
MMLALLLFAAGLAPQADTAPSAPLVDYRIEASLDESTHVLTGRARVKYVNRSESSIDTLWFHQHLNAFRPNSAWARRELEYGERRFQDLGPDDHAFERFTGVTVGGQAVSPAYPGAPDSTVVGIPLPSPLRPGDSVEVRLDWQARLSVIPRRQGRRGRHYDWAQWYPRIAVYEDGKWQTQPLLPQGEFYGEFASYDVTLEVQDDQVFGATGVPVEGDPGWEQAAVPGTGEVLYLRDTYPEKPAEPLGLLSGEPAQGRKRVRWRAQDVHHFAWSIDPNYRFEQGTVPRLGGSGAEEIAIRVLYLPEDTAWDEGVAVRRTQDALVWLQELWGPYLWPQLTNLHRIEGGGTEFPMLVMNGSASQGLIIHEVGHQYLHGMLANNEWREGWLDEGFQSFIDGWAAEEGGADTWQPSMHAIRQLEAMGRTQPIATPGAEFADPEIYSQMTYTKPSLVLRMLRELVGDDIMREILREYFRRNALSHVSEQDLREVVDEVTGKSYDWFFDQWVHTTATLDFAVANARTERTSDGRWRTVATIRREGEAWMPVEVAVDGERVDLTGREREQTVEVITPSRPQAVVVDPEEVLLDINPANNRRRL